MSSDQKEQVEVLRARYKEANEVIAIIAAHGRRFLYSQVNDRTAKFGLDGVNQIWYVDDFTGMKIFPFGEQRWPGFSHGGTLKGVVGALAHYIKTGEPVPVSYFADDNHWAYGDDMRKVREEVVKFNAVK
jgi:hypothetical protein